MAIKNPIKTPSSASSSTYTLPSNIIHFIWHFLKPHKIALLVFTIVSLIWSSEITISPYLLKLMIDGLNKTANNPQQLLSTIALPAILYTSMGLMLTLTFRLYGYTCLRLFPQMREQIIANLYAYISQHSYRYFQDHYSGDLSSKLKDINDGFEQIIQIPNEYFIPRTIMVLIASGALSLIAPKFAIALLVWIGVFMFTTYYFAKSIETKTRVFSQSLSEVNGQLTDNINNSITTKIFTREPFEFKRIFKQLKNVSQNDRAMKWTMQTAFFAQGLLAPALVGPMLYLLIHERMQGNITVGDFAFVLSLSMMIMMTIWDIGRQVVAFISQVGKCNQALNILLAPHDIEDQPDAQAIHISKGDLQFNQVSFYYSDDQPLFKDLSIHIKPGQKIGLVGYSGGGKSSFIKLVMRLFDVQAGKISIDDQDITCVTKASLRSQIAMIPQDPEMFHRSILDNIRYGNVDASMDAVFNAAKKAHCHEFIMSLSSGYDTMVGEKGVKLSGGQRQRIAIARAILKSAPILILDEATSALDSVTEQLIQDSLRDIMQDRTTIVVAHRLSTLREMDRLLFFHDGKIIEDGSLDELIAHDSHFAKLWNLQCGGYLPDIND